MFLIFNRSSDAYFSMMIDIMCVFTLGKSPKIKHKAFEMRAP